MSKRHILYYTGYSLLSLSIALSIPLVFISLLFLKLINRTDQAEELIEAWDSFISTCFEMLWLYKDTGYRYRAIELRCPVFEDKRDLQIKNKDCYITPDVALIEEGTIIYFEPFDCPVVKKAIRKHLSNFKAYAGTKHLSFFSWPVVGISNKSFFSQLAYKASFIYRKNRNHEADFFKNPVWVSELLHDWLDANEPGGPCLLYNTGQKDFDTGKPVYEVFYLPRKGKRVIRNAVYYFIFKTQDKGNNIYLQLSGESKDDRDLF